MPKRISNLSLVTDEGLDLQPLVGSFISHLSVPEQQIIEDAVVLNPKKTLSALTNFGMDATQSNNTLARMQRRFQRYDEEIDFLIPGRNTPLSAEDVLAIHIMLEHSRFFMDGLHELPHLNPQQYCDAADNLETIFGSRIPQ